MTTERIDLSLGSSLERMEPVSRAPVVQGQSSPAEGQSKQRRRPAPPEAAEAASEEPLGTSEQLDDERPQHRVDKLA
jgi:hypothetical protein